MQEKLHEHTSSPSLAVLVGEIIADAQKLIRQEFNLARTEVQSEWLKFKAVAVLLVLSAGFAGAGVVLLGLALAHVISELASAPLSLAYLLSAALFFIVGGASYAIWRSRVKPLHAVPQQTVQSIKENVKWIKKQV